MSESAWETDYEHSRDHKPTQVAHSSSFYTESSNRYASARSGRKVGFVMVFLRIGQVLLTMIAIAVVASDKQYLQIYNSTLNFNRFMAYRYLLAANVVVFLYAIVQLIHSVVLLIARKAFPAPVAISAYTTFILDQVLAYILVSASAAGADASHIIRTGEAGVKCSDFSFGTFCTHAEAAVAVSFVAALFTALAALMSAYRLFSLLRHQNPIVGI